MTELTITRYMAKDNTVFDTKEACEEYENSLKEFESLKRALRRIKELCSNDLECDSCPFAGEWECMFRDFREISDCIPINWRIEDED